MKSTCKLSTILVQQFFLDLYRYLVRDLELIDVLMRTYRFARVINAITKWRVRILRYRLQ